MTDNYHLATRYAERCNSTWTGVDGDKAYRCTEDAGHAHPHQRVGDDGKASQLWFDDARGVTPHVDAPDTSPGRVEKAAENGHVTAEVEKLRAELSATGLRLDQRTIEFAQLLAAIVELEQLRVSQDKLEHDIAQPCDCDMEQCDVCCRDERELADIDRRRRHLLEVSGVSK